jgi:regulatory protein
MRRERGGIKKNRVQYGDTGVSLWERRRQRMEKKYISRDAALQRMQRYCAYQDRCHLEARRKLLDLGVYGDVLEEILSELVEENFLNEERFARSFARGKFEIKGWGRVRITQELKARQISDYCRRKALEEIDENRYKARLEQLLEAKIEAGSEREGLYLQGQILFQWALRKGYESALIQETLDKLLK